MPGMSQPLILGTQDTSVTKIPCGEFTEAGEHIIHDIDTDFCKVTSITEKKQT